MTRSFIQLGRLAVLLLWTTTACQGAVIPQQQLSETPLLDHHQQPDQQSSQENAEFLNPNNYYNNDPPTTTSNLMVEAPSDDTAMQNDFTVPPPMVNIKVPDTGSPQDSFAYNNNQPDGSLINHAMNNGNDDMLDNPSGPSMEEEDDNELYDDDEDEDEEEDLMANNDEEGYLFDVPDNNDGIMDKELVVDPSTGMPAFRNKNDNDFDVMNNQPEAQHNNIDMITPPSSPVDQMTLPARDASTSITPLHQHSFFGDWRVLLAAAALLAIWKLVTGKPRFMGASTRLSIAETVGPHLERRKQLIQKYEFAAAARRIPIHTNDIAPRKVPSFVFPTIPEEEDEEGSAFERSTRRVSTGHIRRPPPPPPSIFLGSAMPSTRTVGSNSSFHHSRHVSFSGKFNL
ncbi:hypothetical protein K492DRAFT_206046 [Lichtheimia hyalospora FSU 10163]|nr:hypothetical protein K492DRAFT_206046 [Lichtheimia hyalospora FSU 10163]